nr:MAG TPA_asm: hypothetical protein [Caudoviricetes sp.]
MLRLDSLTGLLFLKYDRIGFEHRLLTIEGFQVTVSKVLPIGSISL